MIRQWEIWKARPIGMGKDHWFVILSGEDRLRSSNHSQVNGLACFTLRGPLSSTDVQLNSADGFEAPTACQCDLLYFIDKSKLHSRVGQVSYER